MEQRTDREGTAPLSFFTHESFVHLVGLVLDPTDDGTLTLVCFLDGSYRLSGHVYIRPEGQDRGKVAADVSYGMSAIWPADLIPTDDPWIRWVVEDQVDEAARFSPVDMNGRDLVDAISDDPRCHQSARYRFNFWIVVPTPSEMIKLERGMIDKARAFKRP